MPGQTHTRVVPQYVCPCGCGHPVWPIAGGFSTPTSDMRKALVETAEAAPAILERLFGRSDNQPKGH